MVKLVETLNVAGETSIFCGFFVAEKLVSSGLEAPQILPLQPRSPGCLQRGGHKDGDTAQGCNLDSAPTISIWTERISLLWKEQMEQ